MFSLYPCALLVMLEGLTGLCHGILQSGTVYSSIILSLIWYFPRIVIPAFSLGFKIAVVDRCGWRSLVMLTVLGLFQKQVHIYTLVLVLFESSTVLTLSIVGITLPRAGIIIAQCCNIITQCWKNISAQCLSILAQCLIITDQCWNIFAQC